MTTRTNDCVVVEPSGLILVCSWCVSRARLAEVSQQFSPPFTVSHGMCTACAVRFDEEIAARYGDPAA